MKDTYDAREQNLGGPITVGPRWWQRRTTHVAALCLLLCLAGGVYLVWWEVAHVRTQRAVVCTSVISLSSEVDARLEALHVKPGQRVSAGQVVARLDDSALAAAVAAAREAHALKRSLHVQAQANAALMERAVAADIALGQARLEIARAALTRCLADTAVKQSRIPADISRAQAQRDEAAAKLQHLVKGVRSEVIEEAKARLDTATARATMGELQLAISREMVQKGLESGLMLQSRQTELIARRNEVREAEMRLAVLEAGAADAEIEAARQVLAAHEAALTLARTAEHELQVLEAEVSARRAAVQEAEAILAQAQARTIEVDLAREKVTAAAAELAQAAADVSRSDAALRSQSVRSPVDGLVLRTFDKVGEVSRKATPMMLVAESDSGFWVEAYISEDDAATVQVGQPVSLEIVAGSGRRVSGRVELVGLSTAALSRDAASNPERLAVDAATGLVWVRLRPDHPLTDVLPGMSARAVIRLSHQ